MPRPRVLAYYFPDWHRDVRNGAWFGEGWDEWSLLRAAGPRFDGHRQPRVPALGYRDEAEPAQAAVDIDLAHRHGVDGFLVDFYWYDDGPYLAGALEDGLLRAPNRDLVDFALMWANHELVDIFPLADPTDEHPKQLKDGAIDRAAFERMAAHIVDRYFSQPNYLRVEGKPWFSIYEVGNLIAGLGGLDETIDALQWFERLAIEAGFPGIHFDAVVWGFGVLPTAVTVEAPERVVEKLGFNSVTSYVWVHHVDMDEFEFPRGDLDRLRDTAFAEYERYVRELTVPFHPNVTVGWDSSPRTCQDVPYRRGRYPFTPVWDQSPEQFEQALRQAADFHVRHPTSHPVITINAWNEWTEGSALLPDTDHGLGYLEAIKRVLGTA